MMLNFCSSGFVTQKFFHHVPVFIYLF